MCVMWGVYSLPPFGPRLFMMPWIGMSLKIPSDFPCWQSWEVNIIPFITHITCTIMDNLQRSLIGCLVLLKFQRHQQALPRGQVQWNRRHRKRWSKLKIGIVSNRIVNAYLLVFSSLAGVLVETT